jgi:hypothetical protein
MRDDSGGATADDFAACWLEVSARRDVRSPELEESDDLLAGEGTSVFPDDRPMVLLLAMARATGQFFDRRFSRRVLDGAEQVAAS